MVSLIDNNITLFMKRNSCVSAFPRRLSEADIRNRSNRNITTKNNTVHSSSKKAKKSSNPTEMKKDFVKIMGSKLNNFMNQNKQILCSKTCKNLITRKPSTANIRNRKSVMKMADMHEGDPQDMLLRWSKKLNKIIWTPNQSNLPYIVISADYLADQDCFWEKPTISPSSVKMYKWLHKNYYVIWVIRTQKIFLSIMEFVQLHHLSINAVFYIKPNNSYTVDYTKIVKQIKKQQNQIPNKIVLLEVIKLNNKDLCEKQTFSGKVPVAHTSTLPTENLNIFQIIVSRVQNYPAGLEMVGQIIRNWEAKSKKITFMSSLPIYIQQYYRSDVIELQRQNIIAKNELLKKQTKIMIQNNIDEEFQRQDTDQVIDELIMRFRKKMVDQIIRAKGRHFQYEGNSVYYIVGDIIKRNYNFLFGLHLKCYQNSQSKEQKAMVVNPLSIHKSIQNGYKDEKKEEKIEKSVDKLLLDNYFFYEYLP